MPLVLHGCCFADLSFCEALLQAAQDSGGPAIAGGQLSLEVVNASAQHAQGT